MFRETIQGAVKRIDGGLAGVLMGFDGIAVESFESDPIPSGLNTTAMEFAFLLAQVRQATDRLELGSCEEAFFQMQTMSIAVRVVSRDYFLAMALAPAANLGRARYVLRVTAPKVCAEL